MMKNRIEVFFYKPYLEDLWIRQSMMADPETMELLKKIKSMTLLS